MSNRLTFSLASLIVLIGLLAAPAFVHAATAAFTSTGPYVEGSEIEVTLTLTPPAEVDVILDDTETNWPYITIDIGGNNTRAYYKHADVTADTPINGLKKLVFVHTVGSGETDADGVSIAANQVSAGGGDSAINDGGTTTAASTAIEHALVAGVSAQVVDTTLPTVQSGPTITTVSPYGLGDYITIEVDFSEPMAAAVGLPLKIGEKTTNLIYSSRKSSGTTTAETDDVLVFTYQVAAGDNGQAEITSTAVYPTSIQDKAGNSITANTAIISGGLSIGPVSSSVPTVDVKITSTGPYKAATDTITVTVEVSESVAVTGTPQIALTIGDETEQADYISGAPGTMLVFQHAIETTGADIDDGPVSIAADAISLNGGTIKNGAGTAANLDHAAVNPAASANQIVDSVAPTVTATAITSTGPYVTGDMITAKLTFSEAVTVTGAPTVDLMIGSAAAVKASTTAGEGTEFTFSYTVVATDMGDGVSLVANSLAVGTGVSIQDVVDHDAVLTHVTASQPAAKVNPDTIQPTVEIMVTSVANGRHTVTTAGKATFKLTFSEPLQKSMTTITRLQKTDFMVTRHVPDAAGVVAAAGTIIPATDLTLSAATLTTTAATTGPGMKEEYTLTVEAGADPQEIRIAILPLQVGDIAGNTLGGTAESQMSTFDTIPPVVTVSAPLAPLTTPTASAGDLRFTFDFSEDIEGLTTLDLDRSGPSNYTLTARSTPQQDPSDSTIYRIDVDPKDDTKKTTVRIIRDSVTDMAGNPLESDQEDTFIPDAPGPDFVEGMDDFNVCVEDIFARVDKHLLPKASDEDPDQLTYTLTRNGAPVPNLTDTTAVGATGLYWETIERQHRYLRGKATASDTGTYVWTVTDQNGKTDTVTFTVTVKAFQPPEKPANLEAMKVDSDSEKTATMDRVILSWDVAANKRAYPDCIPAVTSYTVMVEKLDEAMGPDGWDPSYTLPTGYKSMFTIAELDTAGGKHSVSLATLSAGIYRFSIKAHNAATADSPDSDYAEWVKTEGKRVVLANVPKAPQDLEKVTIEGTAVTLNWLRVPDVDDGGAPIQDDVDDEDENVETARATYYGEDVDGDFGGYVLIRVNKKTGNVKRYPAEDGDSLNAETAEEEEDLDELDPRFYTHPTVRVSNLERDVEYLFRVFAMNVAGQSPDSNEITVYIDPLPASAVPTFGDQDIDNIVATKGQPIDPVVLPEATDADTDSDDLTYSIVDAEGEETTSPGGLTFDASKRTLTGTPAEVMVSTAYTYKVVDGDENEDTIPFFITVNDQPTVTNNVPVFADTAKIEDIVATVGQSISGKILPKATDADGDTLTYSITPDVKEIGLTFDDTATIRALTGEPTKAQAQTVYAYKATDTNGGEAVIPFFITVNAAAQPVESKDLPATYADRVTTITSGMIAADGFASIGSGSLPDLQEFFEIGGTIGLSNGDATDDKNLRSVVISEILWGLDMGAAADQQTQFQFIELYNTTGSAIDLTGWTLTFTDGRPVPASDIDQVSNRSGAGWVADIGQSGTATGTSGLTKIVSMYRDITYKNVVKSDHDADATKNRNKQLEAVPSGNAKGSWKASTRRSTYNRWVYDSKRAQHFKGTDVLTASSVAGKPFIINEIGNDTGSDNDWVELRNLEDSEQTLKNYALSRVTAKGTDTKIFDFKDQDWKVPANGYVVISTRHPRDTDLAAGKDISLGANDQVNAGASHSFVVKSVNLPDDGKFALILRNAHDKQGSDGHLIDVVATRAGAFADNDIGSSIWPLKATGLPHANVIDGTDDEDFRSPRVYQRNSGNGRGEKQLSLRGYTGVGYDRAAAATAANGGTPGYDNGAVKEKIADLSNATVKVSEIMLDPGTGRRNLPQWIELYNSSMVQAVNTNGWKLHIENKADGVMDHISLDAVLTLDSMTIAPNQTILIVTNTGSMSDPDHFPSNRVVNLWTTKKHRDALGMKSRTDQPFSTTGFYIEVTDKDNKQVDEVGNIDGSRRTRDEPLAWDIKKSGDEGRRSSLIRVYDDGAAEDGMMEEGWVLAEATNFAYAISETYYGDPDDYGTPGVRGGGPLPVSLSKFRPERLKDTGEIVIRWVTESELNNAGFNILRSEKRDGAFKQINTKLIKGQGTTSERTDYTWKDSTAKPNVVYYYQIQDVSLDGQVQTLRMSRLKGNVTAAGKLTTTWGDLKALQ